MPEKWLQIKGDPSVREFLFEQSRVESMFDEQLDRVHEIVACLLVDKGAFHVKVHYSSSQLTCWFCDDAFRYRVYVREEVLQPGFLAQFHDQTVAHLKPVVDETDTDVILAEFRRLRLTDKNIYLRNASINRINGMIGMTFSCDGSHYIDHRTFFSRLETFATSGEDEALTQLACEVAR
jgi:hypothetical protein